jgi:hypothetical protein
MRSAYRASQLSLVLTFAWGVLLGAPVFAQGDGLTPTPDGRYRVGFANQQLTLVDNIQFRTLMGDCTAVFYSGALVPAMRMEPRDCGADIIITIANDTDQVQPLGAFSIDGIRLPANLKQWIFGQDASVRTLTTFDWFNHWVYPNDTYSPVQVIGDNRHILGFSILYPVVEYDHEVEIYLIGEENSTPTGGPPHWKVQFRLRGDLPRGASRSYTIAIRATTANRSYLYTLVPYRNYFRSQFGPVHYTRDARPISGSSAGAIHTVSSSNPQGWAPLRPDLNGWTTWVNQLVARRSSGYRRVMLWTPSGVFPSTSSLNFPYRFMTPINDYPQARSTLNEFHRVRNAGMEMGFWWGNNATLMRGWANTVAEPFDPQNPQHVALGFAELDVAVGAGATMIGLDAFKQNSPANMHRWLLMLREHAPNIKFITENAASDYLHNVCPTFHEALAVRNPHVLADFLNPGHETWAAIASTPESRQHNRNPTTAEVVREVRRVADLGFVPLVYGVFTLPSSIKGAESWTRSIPRDLQGPSGGAMLRNRPGLRR